MSKSVPWRRCSQCSAGTRRQSGVCVTCDPPTPTIRPERPCAICGRRTTARGGLCWSCDHVGPIAEPTYADALTGGRWVNVRGIQRWVADEPMQREAS